MKFNAKSKAKIINMVTHGYSQKAAIVQQWVAAAGLPKELAYHIYWRLRMPDQLGYIFTSMYHRMLLEVIKQGGYPVEEVALWTDSQKLGGIAYSLRIGDVKFIAEDFKALRLDAAKIRPTTLAKWL